MAKPRIGRLVAIWHNPRDRYRYSFDFEADDPKQFHELGYAWFGGEVFKLFPCVEHGDDEMVASVTSGWILIWSDGNAVAS